MNETNFTPTCPHCSNPLEWMSGNKWACLPCDYQATLSRPRAILAGLRGQNEQAIFEGRKGFWVQADCVFIEATSASYAILKYRERIPACSHNRFCGSIMREAYRFAHEEGRI